MMPNDNIEVARQIQVVAVWISLRKQNQIIKLPLKNNKLNLFKNACNKKSNKTDIIVVNNSTNNNKMQAQI